MLPVRRTTEDLQVPSTGITLLEGPGSFGKDVRSIVQHWTAMVLSQGDCVHWIDGGHRFDPSQFFPPIQSLNCNPEEVLRRLYIGRGFTLHQLHQLILRVRHEVSLTKAPLIVIDGLLAMFLDQQIKQFEARSILRHCLAALQKLSKHCSVVLLDGKTISPLHQQLKCTMRPYLNKHFRAFWDDRKHALLRLAGENEHYLLDFNPHHTENQQRKLDAFTTIDPNVSRSSEEDLPPTIRRVQAQPILPESQDGDSDRCQSSELDAVHVRIPVQE